MDVYDLDFSIANFVSGGLKKHVEENKKATFPSCGCGRLENDDNNLADDEFCEKVNQWNVRLETLALKFEKLSREYDRFDQKEIDQAFEELKRMFSKLWI